MASVFFSFKYFLNSKVALSSIMLLLHTNNAIDSRYGNHIECDEANPCNHQHLASGIECDIACTTKLSCKSSQISFSDHCDFGQLSCSGSHSCYESEIECNSNGFCELTSSSVRSMKRSSIHCPANSLCFIHCTDFESCSLSDIRCDEGSQCFLDCMGDLACVDVEIYAQNASNLQVYCQDGGCDDLSMYCPFHPNNSSMPGIGTCSLDFNGNGSTGISVYTHNGLSDVILSNLNGTRQDVNIFCGEKYASQCKASPFSLNGCMETNNVCDIMMPEHVMDIDTTAVTPRR